MATISQALAIAVQHHQAGRLQAAEQIYRQILQAEPNQAQAWHLLGVIAHQVGRPEIAAEYIQRAVGLDGAQADFHNNLGTVYLGLRRIPEAVACWRRTLQLKPDYAVAHFNLANALKEQGKLDEAIAGYRRALELKPDLAEACYNLGVALKDQGQLDEALACYRRALDLKPDLIEAHNNLGVALQAQGKLDEAVDCYRRALELKPDYAQAHSNLGAARRDQGKLDEAIACCRRALELQPDHVEAQVNLGNAIKEQGNLQDAIACYRRALELKPNYAKAHSNLGAALNDQGELDEALACYHRALELKPDYAEAQSNLGIALKDQAKLKEALARFRRALELKPDYADAHANQSLLLLLTGDFDRGWAEYQWRWKTKECEHRDFPQSLWEGQPLEGRTILLHAEQGLGDTLQFVRYAPLVQQRHGQVVVECPRPLLSLLRTCTGIDRLVARGDELPPFDVQAPILSLPGIFRASLGNILATIPYLSADPDRTGDWRRELGPLAGIKIGIAWQGNPKHGNDRNRSIPLDCFEPLAHCCGVHLLSLQKGAGVEQLQDVAKRFAVAEVGSRLNDFMDAAAVLANLDLVVTCDTAVAHLAGALGVPVWVALPLVPDWRWLLDRSDSPWYPSMRLFRQESRGDWQGVFQRIAAAVGERFR
jgi:tetratricopeptide (TPR) repeat protein